MQPVDSRMQGYIWPIALLSLVLTAITDARTGYQFSLLAFYFFPVAFLAWHRGLAAGVLMSFLAAATWLVCDYVNGHVYVHEGIRYWNAFMRLMVFGVCSASYASLRKALQDREEIISELKLSLDQVKTLSGYLPTCPCCHRIRLDSGKWQGLEAYVSEQSRIEFVSVVCPECGPSQVPLPDRKKEKK